MRLIVEKASEIRERGDQVAHQKPPTRKIYKGALNRFADEGMRAIADFVCVYSYITGGGREAGLHWRRLLLLLAGSTNRTVGKLYVWYGRIDGESRKTRGSKNVLSNRRDENELLAHSEGGLVM
jgi:hypothetical protein